MRCRHCRYMTLPNAAAPAADEPPAGGARKRSKRWQPLSVRNGGGTSEDGTSSEEKSSSEEASSSDAAAVADGPSSRTRQKLTMANSGRELCVSGEDGSRPYDRARASATRRRQQAAPADEPRCSDGGGGSGSDEPFPAKGKQRRVADGAVPHSCLSDGHVGVSTEGKPPRRRAVPNSSGGGSADEQRPPDLARPARKPRSNVSTRRRAFLRQCLALGVLLAHDALVERKQRDPDASVAAATAAESGARGEAAANSSAWDALHRGGWHPAFDVAAVTPETAIQHLQRQRENLRQRATAPKAAAAPAGTVGTSEAAAAAPRRAARPPVLTKRHRPCTDTSELDPVQLLQHLKQLPWYEDQVGRLLRFRCMLLLLLFSFISVGTFALIVCVLNPVHAFFSAGRRMGNA